MKDIEAIKPLPLNSLRRVNQNIITVSETEGANSLLRDRLSAVKREVAQARTIVTLIDELERTRAAAKELRDCVRSARTIFKIEEEGLPCSSKEAWVTTFQEAIDKTKWLEELG